MFAPRRGVGNQPILFSVPNQKSHDILSPSVNAVLHRLEPVGAGQDLTVKHEGHIEHLSQVLNIRSRQTAPNVTPAGVTPVGVTSSRASHPPGQPGVGVRIRQTRSLVNILLRDDVLSTVDNTGRLVHAAPSGVTTRPVVTGVEDILEAVNL